MTDETPPKRPATPEPASDAKKHANKLVVLSSVAKPPLDDDESLLGEASPAAKGEPSQPTKKPGDGLIHPVGWTTRPGGTTTIIKLPPKTGVLPRLTSLSPMGREQPPPLPKQAPPPLGEDETKRLPPIKLQPPTMASASGSESIFSSGGETAPAPVASTTPPPSLPAQGEKDRATQPLASTVLISKSTSVAPPQVVAKPELHPHPSSLIPHAPPLVPHDASSPVSEEKPVPKMESSGTLISSDKGVTPPAADKPTGDQPTQRLLPMPSAASAASIVAAGIEMKAPVEGEVKKMRLPPRATVSARLKKAPEAGSGPGAIEKPAATVTPPKVFPVTPPTIPIQPAAPAATVRASIKATTTPPTIPMRPAPGLAAASAAPFVAAGALKSASSKLPPVDDTAVMEPAAAGEPGMRGKKAAAPSTRAARLRKRRIIGIVTFYVLFVALLPCLYFAAIYFSQETRVEGQIIPPPGMVLANEAWIVTDFRDLASGISSDLASDRAIVMEDMQEKLGHVQRAQADVAAREARIRALTDQIKADQQQQMDLVKQARDASQQIWDGPGAELEADYQSKLAGLNQAIAQRAAANHLQYSPDPNYFSPEVWANAYRLALYQVPAGVDTVMERLWLDDQMKNWHDFTKSMDQKQNDLREQATQLKMAPASKIADLKTQVDDLQTRIDGTIAEEEPLKAELEQAQADLTAVQTKEAALDAKPLEKLDALPESNITKRLPLTSNGRFSWREVEKESKYDQDEKAHVYWIFARAYRSPDGRQYWALHRFTVEKNTTVEIMIEPDSFISTKAILRPDLSPDEQAQ
jgi:hypothetical protein